MTPKYGEIFSIFVGRTPIVVLNSYDLIKEAFSRPELVGRPGNFSGTFFQKGKTGITTTEGKHWKIQREFLASHLQSLTGGQGYKGFEEVILDEVADLKTDLGKRRNEPVAVSYKLNVAIINILWNLACGRKLHPQQQEFQTVVECVDKVIRSIIPHCCNKTIAASAQTRAKAGLVFVWFAGDPVHVTRRHLLLHADPDQDPARVRHQHRAGPLLPQPLPRDQREVDPGAQAGLPGKQDRGPPGGWEDRRGGPVQLLPTDQKGPANTTHG